MKLIKLTAGMLPALLAAAAGAAVVPAGTAISGSAGAVLGLDAAFQDVPGSHVTALTDDDLEFLSNDAAFSVGFDFFSDGRLVVYDNTGAGLAGPFSFSFSFDGLAEDITSFVPSDLGGLDSGRVSFEVVDRQTVRVNFENLAFSAPFGSFSAQIGTTPAVAVPAPPSLALVAGGLALLAGVRRTRPAARS